MIPAAALIDIDVDIDVLVDVDAVVDVDVVDAGAADIVGARIGLAVVGLRGLSRTSASPGATATAGASATAAAPATASTRRGSERTAGLNDSGQRSQE
ncbi:MAG: hypothetical protein ACHP83_20990, partial [Burkholderiales bacterium]